MSRYLCMPISARDSGNNFCCFSFLRYPKRNDFVLSHIQKKRPELMLV